MVTSSRLPLYVVGSLAVAALVTLSYVAKSGDSLAGSPSAPVALFPRRAHSRSSALPSRALSVMRSDRSPLAKARFQSLDCGCTDISNMWKGDNVWGHYKAMCCDKNAPKTLGSVLAKYIKEADDNDKKLAKFLKSARTKLNPKISLVVDAVTLKNAGRPGPMGPVGKKGPQGYAGLTGDQGPRGPAGIQGPIGAKGHPGQQGYRGETGDVGNKGTQGWEGPLGAPGYVGPDGARGPVGTIGPPGPPGPQGPPGNQGGTGGIGDAGPMGATGRAGGVTEINAYKGASTCQHTRGTRIEYLDRQYVDCRGRWGDSFINFYRLGQYNCGGADMKYRYTCVTPARFYKCADENGNCQCDGNVRFGSGNRWSNAKAVTGSIGCNAGVFGDPWPMTPKTCECAAGPNIGAKDCDTYYTPCSPVYGQTADWLRLFKLNCPGGKLMTHFKQIRGSCQGNEQQYQFSCCAPSRGYGACREVWSGCQQTVGMNTEYIDRAPVGCGEFEALQNWGMTSYGCDWWTTRQYKSTCCRLN